MDYLILAVFLVLAAAWCWLDYLEKKIADEKTLELVKNKKKRAPARKNKGRAPNRKRGESGRMRRVDATKWNYHK
jgi:hypothetical protein